MRAHRGVDAVDPRLDHVRRILGEGEPRLRRVDPELPGGAVDRRFAPAVEHRILADRQGEAEAELLERGGVGHGCLNGRLGGRAQADEDQRHHDRRRPAPVERVNASP